ncbi:glycoside hydrolase family 172 protein [Enterococcus gallinarum]|uniref:glycoside hydrolase family 172 protein n=1 Tax=Enterococcus gallinarum TaxID=1353 RepID=UPI0035CBA116
MLGSSLRDICKERTGKRKRASSYDVTGGNRDFLKVYPGDRKTIATINGSGCVTHIWMTMAPLEDGTMEDYLYRKVIIRMFWDNEEKPSVEVPIGDFFGMGHGITKNYSSAPFQMGPESGQALNCVLPMPFAEGARFEIESQAAKPIKFYYYIDYESYEESPDTSLRFHATWHRELTQGINSDDVSNAFFEFGGKNTDGKNNYVLLEAEGKGHYIGCNLNIHNLRYTNEWNWYGEGDDMIFIDGEEWPPTLHGTGMEDYFNTAWCPTEEYQSPYFGLLLGGDPNWAGKISTYRYHIEDPIMFDKSIKVTIEHGHNNHRSDDYSSTAYWYQTEPHKEFQPLISMKERLPLPDIKAPIAEETEEFFNY